MTSSATFRELAVDFLCMAAKDTDGRRHWDPLFQAVTERRQSKGYSSCGDLGHWLLYRLGFRFPWINRQEHAGWRVGKNLNLLCAHAVGGANRLAKPPYLGQLVDAGDVLVLNVRDVSRSHVAVVLGSALIEGGSAVRTAEYGQFDGRYGRACGRTFVRQFGVTIKATTVIRLGASSLDSVLSLDGLAAHDPAHVAEDDPSAYYRMIASRQRVLRLLQPCMRGSDVAWWCEELKAKGLDSGLPLDVFGAQADRASTLFQEACGLGANGKMGPDEWAAMMGWSPVYSAADSEPQFGPRQEWPDEDLTNA